MHIHSLESSPYRNKDSTLLCESTNDTNADQQYVCHGEVNPQCWKGRIEYLGLWKDTEDRAMPIQMNQDISNPNQIKEGVQNLIQELLQRPESTKSGIIAFQCYNQIHYSPLPDDESYKKYGFISMGTPSKSTHTEKVHLSEGITIEG